MSREAAYVAADKKEMLIWGGASSTGSAAVHVAKLMGFTVYTTASEKHHEYLKGLGASKGIRLQGGECCGKHREGGERGWSDGADWV